MNRIGKILFAFLIFTSCANDANNKNEKTTAAKQPIDISSIIGKWKITDGNPILEGTMISEYFENYTFQQNGVVTSFQPNYTCQMKANGTFSISDSIFSYSYLADEMYDCKPQEYQLMVNSFMSNKQLETSQNKIIQLDSKVMIQENVQTKKRFTFTRVIE